MKTIIDLPRPAEVKSITYDQETGRIIIEHRFYQRQTVQPVCFLTASGDKGLKRTQVVIVNANTGSYSVAKRDREAPVKMDLSEPEYEKWISQSRRGAASVPDEKDENVR